MARGEGARGRGRGRSGPKVTAFEGWKKRKVGTSTCEGKEKKEASETTCKWFSSSTHESHLEGLVTDGFLRPKEVLPGRMAGDEATPVPAVDERVIHQQFICQCLSFPLHGFVRGLLHF